MSSTWSDKDKAEIKLGLVSETMSPENSENEALNSDRSRSDSDIDEEAAPRRSL